ncbi:MAG TPA: hypothetical protein VME21_09695 [Steroidobacteraceae bacterium]|nr:hypothetical protein [Steroidobacteraceae bacterium]
MKRALSFLALVSIAMGGAALAQQAPSAPAPGGTTGRAAASGAQDLEPAVDTSAASQSAPHGASEALRSTTAPATPGEAGAAAGGNAAPARTQAQGAAAADAAATPGKAPAAARAPTGEHGKALDHIELDTTDITGNRELPKVMYIVPWKRSDLGDLVGKPVNSLLDEVLEPVDRDVFKRENRYYRAVAAGESAHAAAAATAPPQGAAPSAPSGAP